MDILTVTENELLCLSPRANLNIFALKSGIPTPAKYDKKELVEFMMLRQKQLLQEDGALQEAVKSTFQDVVEVHELLPNQEEIVDCKCSSSTEMLTALSEKLNEVLRMLNEGIEVTLIDGEDKSVAQTVAESLVGGAVGGVKKEETTESEVNVPFIMKANLVQLMEIASQTGCVGKLEALQGSIPAQRRELISHLKENNYFTED